MSKVTKLIEAHLNQCRGMDDVDPEDETFNVDVTTLSDEALVYSHQCLKKYIKVAEDSEKEILPEMSKLLTEIQGSHSGAITRCRDLIDLMESWLKCKESDKCDKAQKKVLLLSIGFLLKALPLRIDNLPFLVKAMVPKDLIAKIKTLSNGVKKNLQRIKTS